MAIGVTLFAVAGAEAAMGAYAGLVSTAALCLMSGLIGGAPGVISAPTGPALVLLTSAVTALAAHGLSGANVLLGLAVVVLLAGGMQFLIGLSGGGKLIKYIPSPVISGFMTGSSILMITSQLQAFAGAGAGEAWVSWRWLPAATALVTIAGVRLAPRFAPRVPGPIAGLVLGTLVFHGLVAVHGAEIRAALGQALHRSRHGLRDVEELQVDEHLLVLAAQAIEELEEPGRHEQLQADLVEHHRITQALDQRPRRRDVRQVEGDDQPLAGGDFHAATGPGHSQAKAAAPANP